MISLHQYGWNREKGLQTLLIIFFEKFFRKYHLLKHTPIRNTQTAVRTCLGIKLFRSGTFPHATASAGIARETPPDWIRISIGFYLRRLHRAKSLLLLLPLLLQLLLLPLQTATKTTLTPSTDYTTTDHYHHCIIYYHYDDDNYIAAMATTVAVVRGRRGLTFASGDDDFSGLIHALFQIILTPYKNKTRRKGRKKNTVNLYKWMFYK